MRPPTTVRFPALPHSRLLTLFHAAVLLAACAVQPEHPACQSRRLEVANVAARPVEQLYYGGPGAWGEDLLGGIEMAPGEARAVVLPGIAGPVLRAVWADGRAIELHGLDPCRNVRIVMAEGGIRAD